MKAQNNQSGIMGLGLIENGLIENGLIENGLVRITGEHCACDHLARYGKAFGEASQPMRHLIHTISHHVTRQVIIENRDDPARHI